jgi:hypothetical protein
MAQLGLIAPAQIYAQSNSGSLPNLPGATVPDIKSEAKAKLTRARSLLAQNCIDEAESIAKEVAQLKLHLSRLEESPAKILADVERVRKDPRPCSWRRERPSVVKNSMLPKDTPRPPRKMRRSSLLMFWAIRRPKL